MNKLLLGVVVLVIALAAAVLVVPGMIDWNDYKAEIAAQAKAATGRELVIDGPISLALLPAPALVAEDVRLANLDGATAPEMVRLKSLQVRIALGPLLGGEFQVETLKLIEPVIELEVLADGRRNWVLGGGGGADAESARAKPAAGAAGAAGTEAATTGPAVRVDSFVIVNGTLVYRDAAAGTVERIEELDASVRAASLSGPFESSGSLRLRGFPLVFEVAVGEVIHSRTVPIDLRLQVAVGAARAQMSGAIVNLAEAPKLKGKLRLEGANLARAINTLVAAGPLPGFLGQAFGVDAEVVAAAEGVDVKGLVFRLGEVQAQGDAAVGLGEKTTFEVGLAVSRIDLDRWLAMSPGDGLAVLAAERDKSDEKKQRRQDEGGVQGKASLALRPKAGAPKGGGAPPAELSGSISLGVDALTFRGGLVRQVRANAELSGGEITISQLSAQFPGSSEIAVFGFVSPFGDAPRFEGEIESSISDLRRVMDWLGIEAPDVPADRLRKLTLQSRVKVTPQQVEIGGLVLNLDSSRLTGAVTVALRKRLAFGANLTVDRLNVDAYMTRPAAAAPAKAGAEAAANTAPRKAAGKAAGKADGKAAANSVEATFGAWKVLNTVDANLVARVKTLVYNRTPIKDLVFDGTLFDGVLEIRRASVDSLAGATVRLGGTVKGLGGIPEMDALTFDLGASDISRLFRLAGIDPPVPPKKLGQVRLKGNLDGSLLKPRLAATLSAAGAHLDVAGTASALPPAVALRVKARHPELVGLINLFDPGYRPVGMPGKPGKLGRLDIAAEVRGDATKLAFSGIKGSLGPVAVAGTAGLDLGGSRPLLKANLETGAVALDALMPAPRTAGLGRHQDWPGGRVVPVAWPVPRPARVPSPARPAALDGRWSRQPIDLSALQALDADIVLKSKTLSFEKYAVHGADVVAKLADGMLRAERISGSVFGGRFEASLSVATRQRNRMQAKLALIGVDVAKASAAASSREVSGKLDFGLDATTAGVTVADFIQGLNGAGSLSGTKLSGKASVGSIPVVGPLLDGVVRLPGLIGGALGGILKKFGRGLGGVDEDLSSGATDLSATFAIKQGIVAYDDLKMVSRSYTLTGAGRVDLPGWGQTMTGNLRLSPAVLKKVKELPADIPFGLSGRLDETPRPKLDVKKLVIRNLTKLPGLGKLGDKLEKKLPGAGSLLKGILGGGKAPREPPPAAGTQPPPPSEPPPPRQKSKRLRPEDLLKGLLKIK